MHADRIPIMELFVAHGAVVNADWNGDFPILFAPRETLDSVAISWLIAHEADPNRRRTAQPVTALDYSIGSYRRSEDLSFCIDIFLESGGKTKYNLPGVMDLLRNRFDGLGMQLFRGPALVDRH